MAMWKTDLCKFHQKGKEDGVSYCIWGAMCKYAHGEIELRPKPKPRDNQGGSCAAPVLDEGHDAARVIDDYLREGDAAAGSAALDEGHDQREQQDDKVWVNKAKNVTYDVKGDDAAEKEMISMIRSHGPFELLMANWRINEELSKIFMDSFGYETMPRCASLNMCYYRKRWHFICDEDSPEVDDFRMASSGAVKAKAMPATAKAKLSFGSENSNNYYF